MAALDFPASPTVGDKYPVTPIAGQPQYTWDGEKWTTAGAQITTASPASALPLMDGVSAQVGVAAKYAREDHVHPSDSAKLGVNQAVRYDIAQGLTSPQRAQARANINVPLKNYIINGAMQVSQENGSTLGTTFGYFPVDCFNDPSGGGSGVISAQQVAVATPGGSPNRIRFTVTIADTTADAADVVLISTKVEGLRAADLRIGSVAAKTVTLQFGIKAPAGTYCVTFRNGAGNRSYVAECVIAAGEANTDVVKSITLTLDVSGTWATDNTVGLEISWTLIAGINYQSSPTTWNAGNFVKTPNQFNFFGTVGNVFELFDVSLTEGASAPPFVVPDYASELQLCKRYFEVIGDGISGAVNGSNTAVIYVAFTYKVSKRATATVSLVTTTPGILTAYGAYPSAAGAVLGPSAAYGTEGGVFNISGFSGLTAGMFVMSNVERLLKINARL